MHNLHGTTRARRKSPITTQYRASSSEKDVHGKLAMRERDCDWKKKELLTKNNALSGRDHASAMVDGSPEISFGGAPLVESSSQHNKCNRSRGLFMPWERGENFILGVLGSFVRPRLLIWPGPIVKIGENGSMPHSLPAYIYHPLINYFE